MENLKSMLTSVIVTLLITTTPTFTYASCLIQNPNQQETIVRSRISDTQSAVFSITINTESNVATITSTIVDALPDDFYSAYLV